MANKITAPHSYAPGKGRPKEYLAYLNEREMAYLRSINGNNMERGPRGLPSFPPKDAIGSSSNAPSKSPASSGVGRDSSRGIGQGAGGSAIGRGPSGPSGGLGGGGKSAPGSSPSSPGGLRGAGGNYGPDSGRPGTTSSPGGGYKGPSSPMSGQGPSYSKDIEAQQNAQVRDAIKAVKNSPAFRNDASSGGIRTLSVGPIGTPVNVGPVMGMQPRSPSLSQVIAGDPISYGGPRVGTAPSSLPSVDLSRYPDPLGSLSQYQRISEPIKNVQARPERPAQKEFYERIAPGASPSTSISSQFPSYKYDAPLTPGVSPEDMARRSALMDQYEREARDIMNRSPDPFSTGNPNMAGNPPAGQNQKENPLAGTGYGTFNIAGVDRMMAAPEGLPPEKTPTEPRDRSFSNSFISPAAAATPGSVDLRGAGYGTFNVPKSAQIDAELNKIENELNAPPVEEMKDMTVEEMIRALRPPGRKEDGPFPDAIFRKQPAETYTSPYDRPDQTYTSVAGGMGMSPFNQTPYAERLNPESGTTNLSGKFSSDFDNQTNAAQRDIRYGGSWRSDSDTDVGGPTDDGFSRIQSSGEIVRDGEFNYPTNADGSPITAEDLSNMPEDVQKEYFDKVRYSRNYDTPYPLTKAEKEKGYVAGAIGSLLNRGLIGAGLKVASVVPGEFGDAAEKLSDVRKTVNAYDRLDPLKQQQMRERAGKGRGFGGGSTSTTSPGGGISDIGSGGKAEPPRIEQAEKEATKPKPKPKENGRRPAIYYKWDLGVDVPSPTDSDYTLYTKYLQEKAAAKAGMAR